MSAIALGSQLEYTPTSDAIGPLARDPLAISADLKARLHLLVVDDDRTLREGCASMMRLDGYNVTTVGRSDEALETLRRRHFDIVLCDLYMTPVSGMDILKAALATSRDTIVIVMTGNPGIATSIEALRAGAWDYLPKPFSASHLQILIGRASRAAMAAHEARDLRVQLVSQHHRLDGVSLLGVSPTFRQALELARKVATTDASVMITGESGTGKEVVAQFIHRHSRRASRRVVPINCGALPEALLESELFGHRKGAFPGADRDKPGLFEVANEGTMFLDELTSLPMGLQAKLLRVLQDGVVRRVGSEYPSAVVDVRLISATNREPQEAVDQGRLREDLMYRLRVVPIRLPALRQRLEDIPLLAAHFLAHFWNRHRAPGDAPPRLTDSAIEFLRTRPWRGNVRELQNLIEQVAILSEPSQNIHASDIPGQDGMGPGAHPGDGGLPTSLMAGGYHDAKDRLIARFEREYLQRLVLRAGANLSRAARLASVDRTTLYRLMEKHGVSRDEITESAPG